MALSGEGVPQDAGEAMKWFRRAANGGLTAAQGQLGLCYLYGIGIPQDYQQAVLWLELAAKQGLPDAQCQLGTMYAGGMGVPRNEVLAERWLTASAQQGYAGAQYNLGLLCEQQGRSDDARIWFETAANKGVLEAQKKLATLLPRAVEDRQSPSDARESQYPNVIVSATDGKFYPAPGYVWVSDEDGDPEVRWSPGTTHSEYPYVVAADTEGHFCPAPGYVWVSDEDGDLRVVPAN